MSRSQLRPLTLLLCFLISLTLTIGHSIWVLPTAIAIAPTTVVAQTSLQQQGRQLYKAGRLTEAITIWQQAIIALDAQGDRLNQASILSNLALAYQQLDNWERAEASIAQSLELLHPISSDPSPQTAVIYGQVWNTQGNLALARSQPTQALNAFEKATDYYNQAGDTNGTVRSQINQTQALQALGFYRRGLTLLSTLSPSLFDQPDLLLQATGLQLLGDLQRLTGDLDTAQTTLQTGLTVAQTLDDPATIAAVHLSLGHTAQASDNFETALTHYQQAAAIATTDLRLRAQLSQWSLLHRLEKNYSSSNALPNHSD